MTGQTLGELAIALRLGLSGFGSAGPLFKAEAAPFFEQFGSESHTLVRLATSGAVPH